MVLQGSAASQSTKGERDGLLDGDQTGPSVVFLTILPCGLPPPTSCKFLTLISCPVLTVFVQLPQLFGTFPGSIRYQFVVRCVTTACAECSSASCCAGTVDH